MPSKFAIFTVLFSLWLNNVVFSADFYISTLGDDNNAGTKESPFATVERAKRAVLKTVQAQKDAECTIWFEDGVYTIQKPLVLSSADFPGDAHIFLKAVQNKKPVISGGIQITGWQKNEAGLWFAEIPKEISNTAPRELFINNERAVRARFPNHDYLRVKKVGDDKRTHFYVEKGDFPVPENAKTMELVLLHDWSVSRIGVKDFDVATGKLTAVDTIGTTALDFFRLDGWEPNPRYFLENAMEFLDAEKEWFYHAGEKKFYLKLADQINPNSLQITIPLSTGLLVLEGTKNQPLKNIHFEGITFEKSAWIFPESGYCGVQACHYDPRPLRKGWAVVPAAVFTEWTENCSFTDCTFRNLGGSGLWFATASKNCSVVNSVFTDISGNGIMIGEGQDREVNGEPWWKSNPEQAAVGNIIENCTVTKCGKQFFGAVGIWCGLTAETLIKNNKIYSLPYTGISIGWMWSPVPTPCRQNTIEGNHIHHIMQILSDGGGIYSLGLQPGSKIINNHIHDVTINAGRAESNGMFLDEGTTDVIIENNLIYNIAKSPLRFHRATTNLVKGNYLFCTGENPPIRYNTTKEEDIQKVENRVFSESDENYIRELETVLAKWRK